MTNALAPPEPTLTPLKRLWLEFYLGRCRGDAVEAARFAGISEDERVLRKQAQRFLNDPAIRFHIEKWTSRHMAPMESLALLASHARGDMGDFWKISDDPAERPQLDLRKAKELGITHLIKKFKIGKDGSIEIELYDAQAAVRDLVKIAGLYRHGTDLNVTVQHVLRAVPTEVREQVLAIVSAQMGQALASGNEEEEPIEAEVIEPIDGSTALAAWSPDVPVVHGFDDEEEDGDEDADV